MFLVVVDSDCKILFKEKLKIEQMLKDFQLTVIYLDDLVDYDLNEYAQDGKYERCILLTKLQNGIMKYHKELLQKKTYFKCWTISILDVENKYYESQFISQIDSVFFKTNQKYHIVFDESISLKNTVEDCTRVLPEKSTYLIISNNLVLAEKVKKIISGYLPEWSVICNDNNSYEYEDASATLVVGEEKNDFLVPPPKYAKSKVSMWLNVPLGQSVSKIKETKTNIGIKMNELDWNIADYNKYISFSNILFENFYLEIKSGIMSYLALSKNDDFVMWDKYGLPLDSSAYTEKAIEEFLNNACCFKDIINGIE